jgi:hypothetical protein
MPLQKRLTATGLPNTQIRRWAEHWQREHIRQSIGFAQGKAKKVRFRSKGRGLDGLENKRNNTGLRCVLQPPDEGNQGWLVWSKDHIPSLIDWNDPVVKHGLDHRIKYARLVRRKAPSPQAKGADTLGYRYSVQLVLEGTPFQKSKHKPGTDLIGLDLGPSTIVIVPRESEARLVPLCEELKPEELKKRRLERKLDRQRRANNPQNYDEKGRSRGASGAQACCPSQEFAWTACT